MTYATIVRKKIRMCARFGHLPMTPHHLQAWSFCRRCGATVSRKTEIDR